MQQIEPQASRAETVTAALLYLMTHYACTRCPRLAVCIARHLQCLSAHPDAAPVVREICTSLERTWVSRSEPPPRRNVHRVHDLH